MRSKTAELSNLLIFVIISFVDRFPAAPQTYQVTGIGQHVESLFSLELEDHIRRRTWRQHRNTAALHFDGFGSQHDRKNLVTGSDCEALEISRRFMKRPENCRP